MPRDRLRSNVQVRTAGIDPSMALMVLGLAASALVLLTMLGAQADSRRSRSFENVGPAATAELGN